MDHVRCNRYVAPHVDGHRMTWAADGHLHDMDSLGRTLQLQIDLTQDRVGLPLDQDVWRGVVNTCRGAIMWSCVCCWGPRL